MGQREIHWDCEDSRGERGSGEKRWARLFHPKGSEVKTGAAQGTLVPGVCALGGTPTLGENLRIKAVLRMNGGAFAYVELVISVQIILLESS